MLRTLLKSKIHRARVTQADLNYIGSITIDQELLEGADLLENEQVDVLNITNGARLTTYAIAGPAGSGVIGINGAAAHLCSPGDVVIICSYGQYTEQEIHRHQPLVLMLDENNHPVTLSHTAN